MEIFFKNCLTEVCDYKARKKKKHSVDALLPEKKNLQNIT